MHGASGILPLTLDRVGFAAAGVRLLDVAELSFAAGPRSIILGPNGAGKSLLLRLCHGLVEPGEGRVLWQGMAANEAVRRQQAMVFQQPVLLRRSTLANVEYPLSLRGIVSGERRARALEALERVGLAALSRRPARVLSGGEKQRLALARAWVLQPQVLFLDEPCASLDPAATRAVEAIIDTFHAAGTKIIMTTHDLGQARRLADDVVFLHHGRVVERGGPDFFASPRSEAARAFLAGELPW